MGVNLLIELRFMKTFFKLINKSICLCIICFLIFPAFLSAQVSAGNQSTAMEIETLLNNSVITYAQAARFILEAANILATNDPNDAFNYAVQNNMLPRNVSPDAPARLDNVSLLYMRAFDMRGGIMYSLFKTPHYAYRELVYLNVISGRTSPGMYVTGERFLFFTNRVLARDDTQAVVESRTIIRRTIDDSIAVEPVVPQPIVPEPVVPPPVVPPPVVPEPVTPPPVVPQPVTPQPVVPQPIVPPPVVPPPVVPEPVTPLPVTPQPVVPQPIVPFDPNLPPSFISVWFAPDSAALLQSERLKLQEYARVLRANPNVRLQISGHTTRTGTTQYLDTLSRNRAQAVADYLVSLGACRPENITITGFGSSRPLASNSIISGMMVNRRVEITILED
jgi:outer membrane protein OmpA-like peptidoglycan-associated protein